MHSTEKIIKPDDKIVEVLAEFPAGAGPFPALIWAPGLRYDMHRPVIAQIASHLLSQGFAVFRFNWAFYTADSAGGQPEDDLAAELQDLLLVLKLARNDDRVQQEQISVAGKSFGSIVAWRVFKEEIGLKSCVLLTPLCMADKSGEDELNLVRGNYPDAGHESRPVLMLAGNTDPHCELETLHRYVASASVANTSAKFNINVLDGNHSLEIPDTDALMAASKFDRNLQLLASHVERFLLG